MLGFRISPKWVDKWGGPTERFISFLNSESKKKKPKLLKFLRSEGAKNLGIGLGSVGGGVALAKVVSEAAKKLDSKSGDK